MAKKGNKSAAINIKGRLVLILLVLLLFAAAVVWVLNFTGIITYSDMLVRLGLKQKPAASAGAVVHFVDVGQGDCTVVVSGNEVMVIDSGDRDDSNKAISYLRSLGIRDIDYLILTHPHADHMGEMAEMIGAFRVGHFIMPRVPEELTPTTKTYEYLLKAIKNNDLKITPAADQSFTIGECSVQIFASQVKDSDNLNNYSALVKINHGSNSFLVTGDCETEEEQDMLSRKVELKANVLRVGHHGSATSSSSDFLDEVDPKYAVISCGKDNDYGHPNENTLVRLAKYADKVFVTAETGTVVFISDGDGLSIETENG